MYQLKLPEKMNMTWWALDRWASRSDASTHLAVESPDGQLTYGQLEALVNRIGNALKREGLKTGMRVMIKLGNHPIYMALNLAVIKLGAMAVPVSTLFRERELEHIMRDCSPSFIISTREYVEQLMKVGARVRSGAKFYIVEGQDDIVPSISRLASTEDEQLEAMLVPTRTPAFILYTSGTTSFPKGVIHTHGWLIELGEPNTEFIMNLRREHRVTTPSEMTWMWPWGYAFWFTLYRGATAVVYMGRFDPERMFEHLEKYHVTHFVGNPTIFRRMLAMKGAEERYRLRLEAAFSSGETLSPELFREWKSKFKCEIYDCMGQTEMHVFCATRPGSVKLGSMGKPLPTIPVGVIRDDGSPCNEGEVGYLSIHRSFKGLALGYLNMEEEWKSRFKGEWYITGDYAFMDADGFLWYVSRVDDLIKSRGYLISPKEVEDVLQEHPAVMEAAVIGIKDPELRERVKAFIVLREGVLPSEDLAKDIREFVSSRIAPFKAPKEVEFVDSLPKTVTGKVMRRTLRGLEESGKSVGIRYRF